MTVDGADLDYSTYRMRRLAYTNEIPLTGARTATAVRTPFARFSAVYAPFSQPPDLTLDRLRREGFLHVFTSWKRIATRAGGLYRRGYPIPPPSNTRQPFRITLSRPSAFSIAFPRA